MKLKNYKVGLCMCSRLLFSQKAENNNQIELVEQFIQQGELFSRMAQQILEENALDMCVSIFFLFLQKARANNLIQEPTSDLLDVN